MKDYSVYLKDIIANIELAQRFIAGLTFETFSTDDKTTYAVIRCVEIIGEATKRVPHNMRQQYPEVPLEIHDRGTGFHGPRLWVYRYEQSVANGKI